MASQGERQLDTLAAFAGRTKKSKSKSQRTPSLAWMYFQCSSAAKNGSGESKLFTPYSGDLSKVPPLDIQSYHYWKSVLESEQFAHPRRYRRRTILIQPLSHSQASSGYKHTEIHPSILSQLCRFCEQFFHGMSVEVAPQIDLSQIRKLTKRVHEATNREQFLVSDIRKFLQSRRPNRAFCVVGVTVADLYPSPEWNFVLGEASMAQGCGVFSFGRYFNSAAAVGSGGSDGCCDDAYVQKGGDSEVEQLRNLWVLMRVMSHELCHIFGLKHCFYFDCAMNESNSIAEAATQPLFLCPVCLRKMQKAVKFDPLVRYEQLLKIIKELHSTVAKASNTSDHKQTNSENESVNVEANCNNVIQIEDDVKDCCLAVKGGTFTETGDCKGSFPSSVSSDGGTRNASSAENVLKVIICAKNENTLDHGLGLTAEREPCGSGTSEASNTRVVQVNCSSVDERETGNDGPLLQATEQRETQGSGSATERGLVDEMDTSSRCEQFKEAILWLEKVVSSLSQFEEQWVEPRAGRHSKSKVV